MIEWSKKVLKKYVSKDLAEQIHKKAEPFITWLKDAEEESSEDDSNDDVELTFDERAKIATLKEEKTNGQAQESHAPEKTESKGIAEKPEDDDIDIDDI